MTSITLISCLFVVAATVGSIAVLPWNEAALEESQRAWTALWARTMGRTAPPRARWATLVSEVGVAPPCGPTVWAPPQPQRARAHVA